MIRTCWRRAPALSWPPRNGHRYFVQYLEIISFHVVVSTRGSLGCANSNSSSCPATAFATLLRADDVRDSSETCDCRKDRRAEKTRRPVRPRGFLYLAV